MYHLIASSESTLQNSILISSQSVNEMDFIGIEVHINMLLELRLRLHKRLCASHLDSGDTLKRTSPESCSTCGPAQLLAPAFHLIQNMLTVSPPVSQSLATLTIKVHSPYCYSNDGTSSRKRAVASRLRNKSEGNF